MFGSEEGEGEAWQSLVRGHGEVLQDERSPRPGLCCGTAHDRDLDASRVILAGRQAGRQAGGRAGGEGRNDAQPRTPAIRRSAISAPLPARLPGAPPGTRWLCDPRGCLTVFRLPGAPGQDHGREHGQSGGVRGKQSRLEWNLSNGRGRARRDGLAFPARQACAAVRVVSMTKVSPRRQPQTWHHHPGRADHDICRPVGHCLAPANLESEDRQHRPCSDRPRRR